MEIYNVDIAHELRSFTGTEHYYMHTLGQGKFIFTDGIHWLRDTLACHWLIDEIVIHSLKFRKKLYCRLQIIYGNEMNFSVKNATHLLQFKSRTDLTTPRLYKLENDQKKMIDYHEICDFSNLFSRPDEEKAAIENKITIFQACTESFDRMTVEFKTPEKTKGTLILYDRYGYILEKRSYDFSDLFIDEKSFNSDDYYKRFRLPLVFDLNFKCFVLMVPSED